MLAPALLGTCVQGTCAASASVIGHDFNRQDFKTVLGGNFVEQFLQAFRE